MTEEENILKMVIEKESWEEIIYYIVSIENLNPWDVDLVKLTDSFIRFIAEMKELDFRIPAKIVFVASILLRLKAESLSIFEEEEEIEEIQKPFVDLGISPELIELGVPMKRIPKRQITLDELIYALKKALAVRERKVERRKFWRARLEAQITEEDITKRIEELMEKIDRLIEKMNVDKVEFKRLVKKWDRDEIVRNFVPLLHLENSQRVKTEQEDFFKEIFISKVVSSLTQTENG